MATDAKFDKIQTNIQVNNLSRTDCLPSNLTVG